MTSNDKKSTRGNAMGDDVKPEETVAFPKYINTDKDVSMNISRVTTVCFMRLMQDTLDSLRQIYHHGTTPSLYNLPP